MLDLLTLSQCPLPALLSALLRQPTGFQGLLHFPDYGVSEGTHLLSSSLLSAWHMGA